MIKGWTTTSTSLGNGLRESLAAAGGQAPAKPQSKAVGKKQAVLPTLGKLWFAPPVVEKEEAETPKLAGGVSEGAGLIP